MKFPARSVAWLLPLFMTACIHHPKQAKNLPLGPPIEDTPLMKPDTAPVNLPPPVVTIPTPTPTATTTQVPEKPLPKHKKLTPKIVQPSAQQTQQAAIAASEVPAIGDFTSGDAPDSRKQTEDSIAELERNLNGITRKMDDGEEKTSTQIREFLKQAKTALVSGDADGAKTLVLKARVLLGELIQ